MLNAEKTLDLLKASYLVSCDDVTRHLYNRPFDGSERMLRSAYKAISGARQIARYEGFAIKCRRNDGWILMHSSHKSQKSVNPAKPRNIPNRTFAKVGQGTFKVEVVITSVATLTVRANTLADALKDVQGDVVRVEQVA